MAKTIFFDDLTKEGQKKLIEDELWDHIEMPFSRVTAIYIDKDTYGYDEDPKKQTLEQHIHARITKHTKEEKEVQQWLLVWNCWDHEFNTIMQEDTDDESFKELLTLRAITVDYNIEEKGEGMDAIIFLSVETEQNRFGVRIDAAVPEGISEQDKYELARKFMGKVAFQMMSIDRRYKNGCNVREALHALGERMPDIVQAIGKREDYKYNSKED